jgi:hypothetical protein
MKKQIIPVVVLILLIALGGYVYKKDLSTKYTPVDSAAASTEAFNTLSGYQAALKNHDVSGLKTYSYKVSDTCQNTASTTECFARMDTAAGMVAQFFANKAAFTNVWFDNKQTILSTDYKLEDATTSPTASENRSIMFFARDNSGHLKVIYFSQPYDSIVWTKIGGATDENQVVLALKNMIIDSDSDGLTDQTENCTFLGVDPATCVKTDPNKRDTNKDGWWDSTEIFVK